MLVSINSRIIDKPVDKKGHGTSFEPFDLTADQLIAHICEGHAYSSQFLGRSRKSENFVATGILAVDIDRGLTMSEAVELPYVQMFASFLHTTASHTDEHNRFRIVFELAEPIADATLYRNAISGLIQKFGGDKSTKDAARFFYGFTKAEVIRFGKVLPAEEVHALAAISKSRTSRNDGLTAKHNPTIRSRAPFGVEHLVTRADGVILPLSEVEPGNRNIHCPFHPDAHPSAFVVYSKDGGVGIHCHSCQKTSWATSVPMDSDWHLQYQRAAEEFTWGWPDEEEYGMPGPYHAPDGTVVWLFDARYLPEIPVQPGVTYIRSPKGTGKTEQLASVVRKLKADGKTILLVGHRRLLLNNLAKRLGIPSYLRSRAADGVDEGGCLAVSLESLPRYVKPSLHKFDVVIIDESEQVVSHFTSKTMATMRMSSRATLEHLVKRAEYLICSDADIGLLTSGLVYTIRGLTHPDLLVLNRYRMGETRGGGEVIRDITLYDDDAALLDILKRDYADGKRCFIATNSKKHADRVSAMLKALDQTKQILLITKSTSSLAQVKRFTNNPADESLQYDAVICSPALSTGVDITFPQGCNGFDGVYGFFRDGITTHFEIDQQLSRVRNPGKICVWVSPVKGYWEVDPSIIATEMMMNRDLTEQIVGFTPEGEPRYADDAVVDLIAWILSNRRASLNDLKSLFIALRRANGWTVRQVNTEGDTKLRGVVRDAEMIGLICAAPDLDRTAYDMVSSKLKSARGVDSKAIASVRRYEIKKRYGVEHVSADLVELDDEGAFYEKFSNLRLLSLSEEGTASNPGLLRLDEFEVRKHEQSSVDWQNRTRKKRLLKDLLTAAGLYDDDAVFSFTHPISKQSLTGFIELIERNRFELESLFGVAVRSDLHRAPVLQLRDVLKTIGLKLTKKSRVIKDRARTDHYWLDQSHWEHVVRCCGLEPHFIRRQILGEQTLL